MADNDTAHGNAVKARSIIDANRYMTLATMDGTAPWASPVAYAIGPDLRLYWTSRRDALHSRNLVLQPTAAVAIFDSAARYGEVDGVQASGRGELIPDEEAPAAWELYVERFPMYSQLTYRVVLEPSPIGMYRFTATSVFKFDPASTDGDRRLEVDLAVLRKIRARERMR